VERISPFDVFVDPDCTSMSDLRWIAQRLKDVLSDVKRISDTTLLLAMMLNLAIILVMGMDGGGRDVHDHLESEDTYVEIWEYYDVDRGKMSVFCDGGDKFLCNPNRYSFSFGHPFVMIPEL
jgi:hypothetical protein